MRRAYQKVFGTILQSHQNVQDDAAPTLMYEGIVEAQFLMQQNNFFFTFMRTRCYPDKSVPATIHHAAKYFLR